MKRFFNYLETLAKRTLFGADGTEYHRSGVAVFFLDAFEGLIGFFGLVILPAMAAATFCHFVIVPLYHWIFD